MKYLFAILLTFCGTLNAQDESWESIKGRYEKMRDTWKANYAKDVRSAHLQTTKTHFKLGQLDLIEAFEFLKGSAALEAQRFRVAYLEFAQDAQMNRGDAVTTIAVFNRGSVHLTAARQALSRYKEIQQELDQLKGLVQKGCSAEFLKWPRDYFNAQTVFPPPVIALDQTPKFDLNYSASVGVTVSFGGNQSASASPDISFSMTAENQTEEYIQGGLVAAGCAVGNIVPGVGCVAGVAIAQFLFSVGKFFYASFAQMDEVFAYNDTLGIIDEINSILGAGTPSREYSDQKVEELCREVFVDEVQKKDSFSATWESSVSDLKELATVQERLFAGLEASQEARYLRVSQLLSDQQALARSAAFVNEGSKNIEGEFEGARNWNSRVRVLAQSILSSQKTLEDQNVDLWARAEKYRHAHLQYVEAKTIMRPAGDSSYRQPSQLESKPLFQVLKNVQSVFEEGSTEEAK